VSMAEFAPTWVVKLKHCPHNSSRWSWALGVAIDPWNAAHGAFSAKRS
jgi:hypothetical protein